MYMVAQGQNNSKLRPLFGKGGATNSPKWAMAILKSFWENFILKAGVT
jgi:hypothetical protein